MRGPHPRLTPWLWALAGALLLVALPLPLLAQARTPDAQEEGRRLREASAREARGDHAGAERVLTEVLARSPASSAAIFALERVLRAQGRVGEILPVADRFLDAEPGSSGVRYLKLRVMVEVDSLESLEEEANAWFQADPSSPDPYREVARVYERAYGAERAIALLADARHRLGDPQALAVEMGDLLARSGKRDEAVSEWSLAIGDDGGQLPLVLRRLSELPGDSKPLTRLLLKALDNEPTTGDRRRAAVRIALEKGLLDEALEQARHAAQALPEQDRRSFLTELSRRGEEMRAYRITLWAYEALREGARDPAEVRMLNQRMAGAALAAGDTAMALDAQERLVAGLREGSGDRLRAMVELIRIESPHATPETLTSLLTRFREEFPESDELDELASNAAAGLEAQGHNREASSVLEGVTGPRSSLERAYLLFGQGQIEDGRAALADALPGLAPARATEAIQLVSLLAALSPRGAEIVAQAAVLEHGGEAAGAVALLEENFDRLPEDDRAGVLGQAARLADSAGDPQRGAEIRERLLAEYPQSPEAPDAMLALARYQALSPEGVEQAVSLLETLILGNPSSPIVPDARRELQRLRARVPGGAP